VSGTFNFTVVGRQGTIAVETGSCVLIRDVGAGPHTVIEQAVAGTVTTGIDVNPPADLISSDFPSRSVTLNVPDGATTTVTFTNSEAVMGRFTGGGSVFTGSGQRVTHGFELHCSAAEKPNNLEINFGGDSFHMESMTASSCSYNPATNVAIITGTGTGRFNNDSGFVISFTMTDAGEPGVNDYASFLLLGPAGETVLSVAGNLNRGNQQFHSAKQ
jgi:hypothetical protein